MENDTVKTYILEQDIEVICQTATSFPDGVMQAFDILRTKLPAIEGRRFFGISRPEDGGEIVYRAAAEKLSSDDPNELPSFSIPAGTYYMREITNFMQHLPDIADTFQQLIHLPNVDPDGYCIEWYLGDKDVRCLVRMQS